MGLGEGAEGREWDWGQSGGALWNLGKEETLGEELGFWSMQEDSGLALGSRVKSVTWNCRAAGFNQTPLLYNSTQDRHPQGNASSWPSGLCIYHCAPLGPASPRHCVALCPRLSEEPEPELLPFPRGEAASRSHLQASKVTPQV